jgi:hypothetical protein
MRSAVLRAKFQVQTVTQRNNGGGIGSEEVEATPVYEETGPNKLWSQWTPEGILKLKISNPLAFSKAKPGEYFFLDLIPCQKDSM